MKTVALSMTRNYVSNWTVADAVREFTVVRKRFNGF